MAVVRLVVGLGLAWAAVSPAAAEAGSRDACAQRVIRDWYTDGRVDRTYPIGCYRAAIRALPEDMRAYTNASQDIQRALAYAREGRSDPAPEPRSAAAPSSTSRSDGRAMSASIPPQPDSLQPLRARTAGESARLAYDGSSAEPASPGEARHVGAGVPYPVLILATLAALLFASAGAGWALARRR